MSKTTFAIGEIVGAVALMVFTFGAAAPALAWGLSSGITTTLFAVGVSAGITGVFGLLQPLLNPQDLSVPGSQQNYQSSAAFRRIIYGYMETGGVLTYDSAPAGGGNFQYDGPQRDFRHQVWTVACHQISSFQRGGAYHVVIDGVDTKLMLDPAGSGYYVPSDNLNPYGGNPTAPQTVNSHIGFEFDLGNPASTTAFPLLSAACPDWVAGKCIQRGRAKVHVCMRYDNQADGSQVGAGTGLATSIPIYVSGRLPEFRFQITGKTLLDTRTGLTAANPSNPALVIYDYLTNREWGEAADPATIDIDSVNAAANICEEQVVVYIASNGGSVKENLYSTNGVFDQSASRGDVLKSLVGAMAGIVLPPGDRWHIFAGAYNPPTATLTDADLRDAIKGDFRISRRDLANGVKGTFIPSVLPTNSTEIEPGAWRWTDFPPYQGNGLQGHPNYVAEDGGQIFWKEARFGFTTSIWGVQRLAKILLQMLRYQVTLHLAFKLTAFPIMAGDTITFIHQRWASLSPPPPTTFFVTQTTLVIENQGGVPTLAIDLVLRQHDPSVYAFGAPVSYANQGEYSQYATLGTI